MTDQELLDRVGRMNRFPAQLPLPEWIADLPISETQGRDAMSTTEVRTKTPETIKERSWRGAIAAVVAVVIALVAVMQIQREDAVGGPGSWPEIVNQPPPADVIAAAEAGDEVAILWVWYDALGSGDAATVQRYVDPDAQPLRLPVTHRMAMVEFNATHTGGVGSVSIESCAPSETTSEIQCQVQVLDEVISGAVASASTFEVTGIVVDGLVVLATERAESPPPWAAYAWILDQLDPGGREAACVSGPTVLDFEGIVFDKTCGDYIWETFKGTGSDRVGELASEWARDIAGG